MTVLEIILSIILYIIGYIFSCYKLEANNNISVIGEIMLIYCWFCIFFYKLIYTGIKGTFIDKW